MVIRFLRFAGRQSISLRFLETILNELKRSGFIKAVQGEDGGCYLNRLPGCLTVCEVTRFIERTFAPVGCVDEENTDLCALQGNTYFFPCGKGRAMRRHKSMTAQGFKNSIDQGSLIAQKYGR